jgi:RimJ/RimL family protein N-acetyltransferase
MEFMPGLLDDDASDALAARIQRHFDRHGFGPFALELRSTGDFIGFTGVFVPEFDAPFTPAFEIGWRLAHQHWGRGYATEAARETLRFAFEDLNLTELVSFTVPANQRSRSVMERLGMHHDVTDDFEHPRLPPGHPLRPHVLYRLSREEWRNLR